ncbi:MAG: hypothetical protein LW834_08055 [Cyanobium sp. 49614_E6]|jgi:hypothetical protein|nr:hypothetical protein [Cyanobium sp. 49614_E6]
MNGPVSIDPSRLKEAKAAYQGALLQDRPGLVDGDGVSHAANPFDMAPDGSVSFNRWTAAANRRSAQDTFFNDTETKADGTTTTVRRPSWQAVPEYYSEQGRNQFDYISAALKDLQTTGFDRMSQIYSKAMGEIG